MDTDEIKEKLVVLETKTEFVIGMLQKMDMDRSSLRDNLTRFGEVIRKEHGDEVMKIHGEFEKVNIEISDLKLKTGIATWLAAAIATIVITLIATFIIGDYEQKKTPRESGEGPSPPITGRPAGIQRVGRV